MAHFTQIFRLENDFSQILRILHPFIPISQLQGPYHALPFVCHRIEWKHKRTFWLWAEPSLTEVVYSLTLTPCSQSLISFYSQSCINPNNFIFTGKKAIQWKKENHIMCDAKSQALGPAKLLRMIPIILFISHPHILRTWASHKSMLPLVRRDYSGPWTFGKKPPRGTPASSMTLPENWAGSLSQKSCPVSFTIKVSFTLQVHKPYCFSLFSGGCIIGFKAEFKKNSRFTLLSWFFIFAIIFGKMRLKVGKLLAHTHRL